MGTAEGHRLDTVVAVVVSLVGGVLMLAVAPLVPRSGLMSGAGLGAIVVAIMAGTTPVSARMWRRHAYTAVSLPVTVLGTAAAELSSPLRLGPIVLVCPLLAVACLRRSRGVVGQLVWGVFVYGCYLFANLPAGTAIVGLLAGGTTLTMVVVLVSALRTALDQFLDELRQQAERDPLTGLQNRHGLRLALAHCAADTGSVVLMDLDHFKNINDSHGHEAGDETLVWFADTLRSALAPGDIAARLGGEEFLMVLPGVDAGEARARADRFRQDVEARSRSRGHPVPVTASIGVADGALHHLSDLLRRADLAMYRAKAGGRNRVELAGPDAGARTGRPVGYAQPIRGFRRAPEVDPAHH
ncbi:MAG TPA: GGDEF domain-containing protein [Catenuloplanes sp.]|jgi:diguanylate cyclase (GGDEF)-like protein